MKPASALVLCAFLSGCCGLNAQYVAADRLTHAAIAPEYRTYVQSDPALGEDQRARRERTLEAWEARLEEAERALKEEKPSE